MPTQLELKSMQQECDLNGWNGTLAAKYKLGSAAVIGQKQVLIATYDFAVLGGAQATVSLKDANTGLDAKLPSGAVISTVMIDTITPFVSGGSATIAIGAVSTTDLKGALAYGSYTGIVAGVPVGSAATSIKLTADKTVTATIATANVTAGKINVLIEYILSI